MADHDSSLPIRTEAAGDVDIFVSDATTPSQKLKVEADGSINTNNTLAAGSKVQLTDGVDDALVSAAGELQTKDDSAAALLTTIGADTSSIATDASTIAGDTTSIDGKTPALGAAATAASVPVNIASDQTVPISAASLPLPTGAATAANQLPDGHNVTVDNASGGSAVNIQDGGNTITVDQATHDNFNVNANLQVGDADASSTNPVPVYQTEDPADEIVAYNTSASVASSASVNHDYTVTAAKTFLGQEIWASASSKIKVEVLVNAVSKFVAFNSTANPNISIPIHRIVKAAATQVIRITITNRDNQSQDVYSTLVGIER